MFRGTLGAVGDAKTASAHAPMEDYLLLLLSIGE